MQKILIMAILAFLCASYATAAERKPLKSVDADAFTGDTQVTPKGANDNHVALAWWIPNEYWASILSRDTTTSEANKQALLDAMSGVSLIAVVQADITQLGAFNFYAKEEIEKEMVLTFADIDGKKQNLVPLQKIETDLEIVLGVFKPILGAAMGNLGSNMHFYVLDDSQEDSSRLLDPYERGMINVKLANREGIKLNAKIALPINALYVPRKCPNGKDAHVSWKFCPWSGDKLAE